MDVGHTRAWARRRRSGPISTICRRRWQHDNATGAVALLQSGCALPARGHGPGETYLSTLRESHIRGMICQVPALEEAVETKEAPGDGLWSGWLVAAGRVAGPAAEAADDPGEPRQAA